MTELQSFIDEFDQLTSKNINPRINCIEWLGTENRNNLILTSNDKNIKLWKVYNKIFQNAPKLKDMENITLENIHIPSPEVTSKAYFPSLER